MSSKLELGTGAPIDVNETWRQIGKWNLANMGAHQLFYGKDHVQFDTLGAHKPKRRILVQLDQSDTYNVEIGYVKRRTFEWVSEDVRTGVHANELPETLLDLYGQYA